jgi:hypothetical protein
VETVPRFLGIAALALCGLLAAPAAPASTGPRVTIEPRLPDNVRIGTTIVVSGQVRNAPAGALLALETLVAAPANSPPVAWNDIVQWRVRGDTFKLRWRPGAGLQTVRIALRTSAGDVARSTAQGLKVGVPPAYCYAPAAAPAQLPAGYGLLTGSVYVVFGSPGRYSCMLAQPAITVVDQTGNTVATVNDGQSYAIALPAGTYQLKNNACVTSATVIAGKEVQADIVCHVVSGGLGFLPSTTADMPLCKKGQVSTVAKPCSTI